jgi:AcrR family transcriptional regulator
MAAVASRAGVAVGTVYRHFPSKSELFAEVFREASQREVDAMADAAAASKNASAVDRVAAGVVTFARRALANRRLAWALLAEPVDPAVEAERLQFRHSYRDILAEVLADGVGSGELPDQDPVASAAALVGAIGEAMVGPLSPTANGADPNAAIESLVNVCIRAIGKETHVNA